MRASSEWTTDELIELCLALRAKKVLVTAEHVSLIEALATELREVRERNLGVSSPPSEDVARRLRVVGWLMLEVSLQLVQKVLPAWEAIPAEEPKAQQSAECDALVDRVANSARFLAWREFCPRALGAIRAQALASSKRDTDEGFGRAWMLHREADELFDKYTSAVAGDLRLLRDFEETLVMLRLAQTGTACRTAEFTIIRTFASDVTSSNVEKARLNAMFRDLEGGAEHGDNAIDVVRNIDRKYGLVTAIDEERLALDTSYRNPGIMAARAYLLMYPVTCLLEKQNRRTWRDLPSWNQARKQILEGFVSAYRAIEHPASETPLSADFERSVIQLRLNLALIKPGFELPSAHTFAPCLKRAVLDEGAVEELSAWLAHPNAEGERRGDANVIGSATMPSYLAAIHLVLGATDGAWQRYIDWRHRWFELDRHAAEPDRKDLVTAALAGVAVT